MTDQVDLMNPRMPNTARTTHRPASSTRLGDRVRQLRVSAGLTQTDLAGTRFSKEYVSQIERGKTRPTRETIEWLAPPTPRGAALPPKRNFTYEARPVEE